MEGMQDGVIGPRTRIAIVVWSIKTEEELREHLREALYRVHELEQRVAELEENHPPTTR